MCDGTETSLLECGFQKKDNCGKNEGAGVICSGSRRDTESDTKIELRGGSNRKEGNVFINGKPVCDDMWDKKDATVACRMLGWACRFSKTFFVCITIGIKKENQQENPSLALLAPDIFLMM